MVSSGLWSKGVCNAFRLDVACRMDLGRCAAAPSTRLPLLGAAVAPPSFDAGAVLTGRMVVCAPFAGIIEDDADNVTLTAALWKNVFKGDPVADPKHVALLAEYTRREVYNVMLVPNEDFYHGWIPWGPVVGETVEGEGTLPECRRAWTLLLLMLILLLILLLTLLLLGFQIASSVNAPCSLGSGGREFTRTAECTSSTL